MLHQFPSHIYTQYNYISMYPKRLRQAVGIWVILRYCLIIISLLRFLFFFWVSLIGSINSISYIFLNYWHNVHKMATVVLTNVSSWNMFLVSELFVSLMRIIVVTFILFFLTCMLNSIFLCIYTIIYM